MVHKKLPEFRFQRAIFFFGTFKETYVIAGSEVANVYSILKSTCIPSGFASYPKLMMQGVVVSTRLQLYFFFGIVNFQEFISFKNKITKITNTHQN